MSGSALSSWALVEDPVSYALDLARQVNCTASAADGGNPEPVVDCLREVPLDQLMSAAVALPTYLSAFGPSVDGVVVKSNYQEDVVTNLLPEFDGYSGSSVAFGARKFQKFEFGSGVNKYDLLFGVVTSEALWRFSSNDIQVIIVAPPPGPDNHNHRSHPHRQPLPHRQPTPYRQPSPPNEPTAREISKIAARNY